MSQEFLDYFDDDDLTSMQRRWVVGGSGNISHQPTGGRGGRACIRQGDSAYAVHAVSGHATYHFGFAYIPETLAGGAGGRIAYIGGPTGSPHLNLWHGSSGLLYITNSAGTTIWAGTTPVLAGSENYIWWPSTIDAASGSTAIYLNGSSTPDAAAFSGATKGADPATINNFIFYPTGFWVRWHDIVFNSGAGSSPYNTYGTDMKVFGLRPSGAGASAALTKSGAATNWEAVGESGAPDGDTSYVYGTSGRDSYAASNFGFTATSVYAARLRVTARKTDATTRTVAGAVRVGSTYYDGTPVSPGTTYGDYDFPFNTNPATSSAWTQSEIEGAEIGEVIA